MFDAKSYYQDKSVAEAYDMTRFKTVRGRLFKFLRLRQLDKMHHEFFMGRRVLDIACGTGLISEWSFRKGYSVVAGDISIQMLELARQKFLFNHSVKAVQFDAQFLPFRDKFFDSVTCFRFLNLVPPEMRKVIHQEITRVCRRYALLSYAVDTRYQRMRVFLKRLLGFPRDVGFPATQDDLKRELVETGMRPVKQMMVSRLLSSELIVLVEVIDD